MNGDEALLQYNNKIILQEYWLLTRGRRRRRREGDYGPSNQAGSHGREGTREGGIWLDEEGMRGRVPCCWRPL
jgi:hypothetical protein